MRDYIFNVLLCVGIGLLNAHIVNRFRRFPWALISIATTLCSIIAQFNIMNTIPTWFSSDLFGMVCEVTLFTAYDLIMAFAIILYYGDEY